MGTIDDLKKECRYCCLEIDASGLEGFRCTNRTVIKTTDSSWCYPKNADMPCSTCEYCSPKQDIKMSIEETIERYENNAEYERTHGNLQGYLEFRQLAEWLEKLQKIKEIVDKWNEGIYDDEGLCDVEVLEMISVICDEV